jgi:hypothetical protein
MSDEAITIQLRGPLFSGEANRAAADATRDIMDRVASYAMEQVQKNLDGSIKNPTPYYETQIQVTNLVQDRSVNDRGVVYGPWLEGVGSRNQTTRFKGYASFRRATETTRRAVPGISGAIIRRYLKQMGGGA